MSYPVVIDNNNPKYIVWNGVRYRRLWTHPVTAESLPGEKDGIVFSNAKRLTLYGHEWQQHLPNFLIFFPNLVELELQANECWSPDDARCISSLPSLRRLTIHEGLGNLDSFMEFCGELKVPELTINTQNNAFITKDKTIPCTKAPHIIKMFISAYKIEPSIYKPMMNAMPNLKCLELKLQFPCSNKIYRRICGTFPLCVTVLKHCGKNETVLYNT